MVILSLLYKILLINIIKCEYYYNEEKPNYLKFPFYTKIISISKDYLNPSYHETNFITDLQYIFIV